MIISKDKFARFPLEGLTPPGQTTGNFQPKTGESPEKKNAENSLIFYCGFKTTLTNQIRANNHIK